MRKLGTRFALSLAIVATLASAPLSAQQDPATSGQTNAQGEVTGVNSGQQTPTAAVSDSSDPNATAAAQSTTEPTAVNLETGLPLRTDMTPLHWGHLSLFAATLVGVYDSNALQTLNPQPAQSTFFNGLIVYALRHRRTQFDLQYMPTVWASNGQLQKDLTNQAADLFTSFQLSHYWSLGVHDTFRNTPQQFVWNTPAFSPDFISNTATRSPFLLTGQNSLMNNVNVDLDGQVGERNKVSFAYNEAFIRLYPQSNAGPTSIYGIRDEENMSTLSASWTRNLTRRDSVSASYEFQRQYEHDFGQITQFQTLSLGYSRLLTRTLSLSLQGGPGWSSGIAGMGGVTRSRTAQGSVSLFKSFHKGGVAATVSRSNNFVGVISTYYNNRYDVNFQRALFRKWQVDLGYSFVQQELTSRQRLNSGISYASVSYGLTRNWAVYSGYYHLAFTGSQIPYARRNVVGGGIRWAWTPQSQ